MARCMATCSGIPTLTPPDLVRHPQPATVKSRLPAVLGSYSKLPPARRAQLVGGGVFAADGAAKQARASTDMRRWADAYLSAPYDELTQLGVETLRVLEGLSPPTRRVRTMAKDRTGRMPPDSGGEDDDLLSMFSDDVPEQPRPRALDGAKFGSGNISSWEFLLHTDAELENNIQVKGHLPFLIPSLIFVSD